MKLFPLILLVILIGMPIFAETGKASTGIPTVYVSPSSRTVALGEHFTVDVNLDNASNLYGYEIWLSYDPSKLNATAIEYDHYLNEPTQLWAQTINNVGGYIDFAISSILPAQAKSGGSPPPLVTINFTAIALGTSPLHLNETMTKLVSSLNDGAPIPYQTSDGTVTVGPPTIYVSPSNETVPLGGKFSVDVDLDYVPNLCGYEIQLSFDPNILNATAIKNDGYLNGTPQIYSKTINNVGGYIDFAISNILPAQAKSGGSPPPLVTIYFETEALGTSYLHLVENGTVLVSSVNGGTAIPYQTLDGAVTVVPLIILPSLGITGYKLVFNGTINNALNEPAIIDLYWSFSIDNVWNGIKWITTAISGSSTPIVNYAIPANTTVNLLYYVYVLPVSGPNAVTWGDWLNISFAFNWNYSSVSYSTNCSAELSVHPGDIAGSSTLAFPYLGSNGVVNLSDLGFVTGSWQMRLRPGTDPTSFLAKADINGNGLVNLSDLGYITGKWQAKWTNTPPP